MRLLALHAHAAWLETCRSGSKIPPPIYNLSNDNALSGDKRTKDALNAAINKWNQTVMINTSETESGLADQ